MEDNKEEMTSHKRISSDEVMNGAKNEFSKLVFGERV
jgi:hypothetical protein